MLRGMKTTSSWVKSSRENLWKRGSKGNYYLRFDFGGKDNWESLKTNDYEVAKMRLVKRQEEIGRQRMALTNAGAGVATVAELLAVYRTRVELNREISEKTGRRYIELANAIEKTWPELAKLTAEKLTLAKAKEWRDRLAKDGTGFVAPGAKGRSENNDGTSPGTINKAIDVLRRVLDIAVERGQIASNPIAGRGVKLRDVRRKEKLPEAEKLVAVFAQVEARGKLGGWGVELGDFCRFLAFTGCRLQEANAVTWGDVDFSRGIMLVHGTKTETAEREVPLVPQAKALLEKIRTRRVEKAKEIGEANAGSRPTDKVLAVSEVTKSLGAACAAVGVRRLTHKDLRDTFATTAIESGVDIPTVAHWLGHKDGGALLMRTYAQHRRPHSLAQAAKVSFGGTAT